MPINNLTDLFASEALRTGKTVDGKNFLEYFYDLNHQAKHPWAPHLSSVDKVEAIDALLKNSTFKALPASQQGLLLSLTCQSEKDFKTPLQEMAGTFVNTFLDIFKKNKAKNNIINILKNTFVTIDKEQAKDCWFSIIYNANDNDIHEFINEVPATMLKKLYEKNVHGYLNRADVWNTPTNSGAQYFRRAQLGIIFKIMEQGDSDSVDAMTAYFDLLSYKALQVTDRKNFEDFASALYESRNRNYVREYDHDSITIYNARMIRMRYFCSATAKTQYALVVYALANYIRMRILVVSKDHRGQKAILSHIQNFPLTALKTYIEQICVLPFPFKEQLKKSVQIILNYFINFSDLKNDFDEISSRLFGAIISVKDALDQVDTNFFKQFVLDESKYRRFLCAMLVGSRYSNIKTSCTDEEYQIYLLVSSYEDTKELDILNSLGSFSLPEASATLVTDTYASLLEIFNNSLLKAGDANPIFKDTLYFLSSLKLYETKSDKSKIYMFVLANIVDQKIVHVNNKVTEDFHRQYLQPILDDALNNQFRLASFKFLFIMTINLALRKFMNQPQNTINPEQIQIIKADIDHFSKIFGFEINELDEHAQIVYVKGATTTPNDPTVATTSWWSWADSNSSGNNNNNAQRNHRLTSVLPSIN